MPEAEVRLLWARSRRWGDARQREQAGRDIDAALALAPQSADALALRGEWLEAQGRAGDAEAAYRRAIDLAPEDARYTYALARHLARREGRDEATRRELRALVATLRVVARSPLVCDFVARYEASTGQPERGLAYATKAIEADPSCAACYETAGLLFDALDKPGDAAQMQRLAINLTPEDERTEEQQARLAAYERAAGRAAPGAGENAPAPISQALPRYPAAARAAGAGGDVIVQFTVTRDGAVDDVRLLRVDDERFAGAVLDAVRAWRFRPATRDGKPIPYVKTVKIPFRYRGPDAPAAPK